MMRLVNADALATKLRYMGYMDKTEEVQEVIDRFAEEHDGDLISRQAAIGIVEFECGEWTGLAETITDSFKQLPAAEPEQKRGTWQRRKGSDCWECSQCHAVLENDDLGMHNFYFCYHCGANMMNKMGYMDIEEVHYE